MRVLGVNAVFHDPAAALVVDGEIVAAAEEERFSRRKHGKPAVPFATWELPENAIAFVLERAGLHASQLDAVAYSYDPELAPAAPRLIDDGWEGLRTLYARRAPLFLRTAVPGLDPRIVRFVPHHVAHAASAYLAGPYRTTDVLVLDGRGEQTSFLAGRVRDGDLEVLATQPLPDSLGLRYEELTEHLGFHRSSDEYKVMAMASYGQPRWLAELRAMWQVRDEGGFRAPAMDLARFAPARNRDDEHVRPEHADLASSVQVRLQELFVELAQWLQRRTGGTHLVLAGGVALNCVANAYLAEHGPYANVWVQPAAGDAGTALGAACYVAHALGDRIHPMTTAALGREWSDEALAATLDLAALPYECPADLAHDVASIVARGGIVAWFQGRSEWGPRALGQRSFLADPRDPDIQRRLNDIKGREQFRPVAPIVLAERAAEIFTGVLPSPYMLFTHRVNAAWREQLPAITHVDGSARVQTVDRANLPRLAAVLDAFARETGVPVLVNTSLNTAGRPMVDTPRDALELFGSAPVDALVLGPYLLVRQNARTARTTWQDGVRGVAFA